MTRFMSLIIIMTPLESYVILGNASKLFEAEVELVLRSVEGRHLADILEM